MLEEAIPALWSAVHGWFTPAVLFLVLNLVIGSIAVTSKVAASASGEGGGAGGGGGGGGEQRRLSRVPSMAFDRLRSFNLSRFAAPAPEPSVAGGVLDLGSYEHPPQPLLEKVEAGGDAGASEHEQAHMERSRSEAAAEPELPRLPARLRKSASEKSAFAHFEAEEAEEDAAAVEARRPATTREPPRRAAADPDSDDDEPEEAAGGEVDARADDFINRFRHQLKLQRIDSFMRYRETIRRGQAAASTAAGGQQALHRSTDNAQSSKMRRPLAIVAASLLVIAS